MTAQDAPSHLCTGMVPMVRLCKSQQAGMTLIEVLIAMLILAIGLLGAAGIQLNALKYTDSALKSTQASFIAYDLLDRIRANAGSDYSVSALEQISAGSRVVDQDLSDFKRNIRQFAGETANGTVTVSDGRVSIRIQWSDARAEQRDGSMKSFSLSGQLVADAPVAVS